MGGLGGRRTFAGGAAIATGIGVWRARTYLMDDVTDRLFRRPSGWVARTFYQEARPHQSGFRDTLIALALGPDDHLLELGCGGGTFLAWALATGCTAHAIDHSAEMLALSARRNAGAIAEGRLHLRQADATELPFPDGQFTAAATVNAFFFFDKPHTVLEEIFRTLVPGGRIAIYTTDTAPPPIARRMRRYTDDEFGLMLETAGYEDTVLRRTGRRKSMQLVTSRKPIV